MIQSITDSKVKFDAIAFCGVSGASLGFSLADHFQKPVAVVRVVEVGGNFETYIIVDDFIESGKTVDRIIEMIGHPPTGVFTVFSGGHLLGCKHYTLGFEDWYHDLS